MDTSETYVKMCERAGEIQEIPRWEYHNFEWDKHNGCLIEGFSTRSIWLPRQD